MQRSFSLRLLPFSSRTKNRFGRSRVGLRKGCTLPAKQVVVRVGGCGVFLAWIWGHTPVLTRQQVPDHDVKIQSVMLVGISEVLCYISGLFTNCKHVVTEFYLSGILVTGPQPTAISRMVPNFQIYFLFPNPWRWSKSPHQTSGTQLRNYEVKGDTEER